MNNTRRHDFPLRRIHWTFLSLAAALLLAGCAAMLPKLEAPKLEVVAVNLGHANLLQAKIDVTLRVTNPNNRSLDVSSIVLQIAVSGTEMATGETAEPFVVPALGETQFDIKLTADVATALALMAQQLHSDAVPYRVTGQVKLASGLIRNLPFTTEGNLPLRRQ
jgi:LEA14-like dessication related protein